MLFQLVEIYACRNFEGNENVFVHGSRDLPLTSGEKNLKTNFDLHWLLSYW